MPMNFVRITVGDKRVCDDCIRFEDIEPAPLDWWETSGYMPRQAPTECGMRCRCGLVPATFGELEEKLNEVIEKTISEGFKETVIDLTTGRTLLLKDFEQYDGLRTLQYEKIAEMEDLILKWKIANDGVKLPKEFFQLQDIEKMTEWLKGGKSPIGRLGIDDLSDFNSNEWFKKLTEKEKQAIRSYTGSSYKYWNSYLKGKISSLDEVNIEAIKTMQSLFEKLPQYQGAVIRGVTSRNLNLLMEDFIPGNTITMKGFISTTEAENIGIIKSFLKDEKSSVILKINTKNGMPINGLSGSPEENEILLNHNSKYRVESVSDTNNYFMDERRLIKVVTLKEI